MTFGFRRSCILVSTVVCWCLSNAKAESFAAELAILSGKEGLGIVSYAENSKLEVISLDGKGTSRFLTLPGLDGLYDIEPHSQVILGSNRGLPHAIRKDGIAAVMTSSIALFTLGVSDVKPTGLTVWPILASLSPKLDMLAVLSYTAPGRVSL